MPWDRYTKITSTVGPEKVWEVSVIRWRMKIYEKIIPWRKNRKVKERKAKVQVLAERRWWRHADREQGEEVEGQGREVRETGK